MIELFFTSIIFLFTDWYGGFTGKLFYIYLFIYRNMFIELIYLGIEMYVALF